MGQRLTNMAIDRVALVDKGANGRPFAVLKRDDAPDAADIADLAKLWDESNAAEPVVAKRGLLSMVAKALGLRVEEDRIDVAKARTFAAILAGDQLSDALYDSWWTLEDALWSAMYATDASGADLSIEQKQALVAQNLDEFKAWLLSEMADAASIAKRDTPRSTRAIEALVRKASAGATTERADELTKAGAAFAAAMADGEPASSEDTDTGDDAQEVDMDVQELAKALQPHIESAVDAAVEKRMAAQPAPAPAPAPVAKGEPDEGGDEDPEDGDVSLAGIAKAIGHLSDRMERLEGGAAVRKSLDGQDGGAEPRKKSALAGILD